MADSPPSDRATAGRMALDASPAPEGWFSWLGGVVSNGLLPGKRHHYAVLELPEAAPMPRAGQFFMLGPADGPERFQLRRPMSVARAWREGGKLRVGFLYTVVGAGTQALASARSRWHLLGPLGRGFRVRDGDRPILVGGGRGVAPLVLLAEECAARGQSVLFLNGARSESELCAPSDLEAGAFAPGSLGRERTEDGSLGERGRVLEALEESESRRWAEDPRAVFFACGPHGLLAAVGREAARRGRPAQVALEAHMACGAGICRSCVVPRATGSVPPPEASNARYILACIDGPVVDPATVDWENAP